MISSNTLKNSFSVWLYKPLFFRKLAQLIEVCGLSFIQSVFRIDRMSVELRSGLWLGQCNTMFLFLCCVWHYCPVANPSFGCQTDSLPFHTRIIYYTEEFIFNSLTVMCPNLWLQNKPKSMCLTVAMKSLCWDAEFGFCLLCLYSDQISPLLSHLSKGHCPRSLVSQAFPVLIRTDFTLVHT